MKMLLLTAIFLFSGCNTLSSGGDRSGRPNITPIVENTPDNVESDTITRPDGEVIVEADYCVCLEKKQNSFGNCAEFCLGKNVTVPTLFVNVDLGPNIELNEELGSLQNWCFTQIDDGNINPSCQVQANDGLETRILNPEIYRDTDGFKVAVNDLEEDKPYIIKLVEVTSGASSTAFQITRKTFEDTDLEQILGTVPVNLYTCMFTAGSYNSSTRTYDFAVKRFFYFRNKNTPPAMPPGENPPQDYCHDWISTGVYVDSPAYERLELTNQIFHMWDGNDRRFFDLDSDNTLDVNNYIQNELLERYQIPIDPNLKIFAEFLWPSYPLNQDNPPSLGFFMQAFVDTTTNEVFCPDQDDYANRGDIFTILGELVGVDTEAIYAAKREPLIFQENGTAVPAPDNFALIRQTQLEKIWFYFGPGNLPTPADSETAKRETIHFYWPPCTDTTQCSSTVRMAHQKLFTVRAPENLDEEPSRFGFRDNISPPDKRFGCVPKGNP